MKFGKLIVAVLVIALSAIGVRAVELGPLPQESRAAWGATHFLRVTHADLTETDTNTAQTISSFAVTTNTAVEFVAMVLRRPFDSGDTNYTGSTLITVGDGSDADLFLTSTELNVDGTEVFIQYPPLPAYTISYTVLTNSLTNIYVNAITTTPTGSALGRKVYTANDTIDVVFTPNEEESLSALTNGVVDLLFKLIQPLDL